MQQRINLGTVHKQIGPAVNFPNERQINSPSNQDFHRQQIDANVRLNERDMLRISSLSQSQLPNPISCQQNTSMQENPQNKAIAAVQNKEKNRIYEDLNTNGPGKDVIINKWVDQTVAEKLNGVSYDDTSSSSTINDYNHVRNSEVSIDGQSMPVTVQEWGIFLYFYK